MKEVMKDMRSYNDFNLKLKKKISSESGASITFALLIFLVCTVAGSIILTAGTAASGRIAQLTRIDQKYYSVSCAAQLLGKELSGQEVVIKRIKEDNNGTVSYSTYINDMDTPFEYSNHNIEGMSFLTKLTARFLFDDFGEDDCEFNSDDAWEYSMYDGNPVSDKYTLTHSKKSAADSDVIDFGKLAVDGICALRSDGTLLISIKDKVDNNNKYVLTLTLAADIDEDETVDSKEGPSKITRTKTSRIRWKVSGISKGDKIAH